MRTFYEPNLIFIMCGIVGIFGEKELSNLGHKITVINNCYKNEIIDDISWKKIQSYKRRKSN